MIVWNRSTLSINSEVRTAAEISAVLGLQPTASAEKGDPKPAALAGRQLAPRYMQHQRSQWLFNAGTAFLSSSDDGSEPG